MWDTEPSGVFGTPSIVDIDAVRDGLTEYLNGDVDEADVLRPMSDAEAAELDRHGSFERFGESGGDYSGLASDLELLRSRVNRPGPRRTTPPREVLPPDRKAQAFAAIAHIQASHEPDVVAFRQDELQGELVAFESIHDWVAEAAATDGPATTFVRIPSDADSIPTTTDDYKRIGRVERTRDILQYPGTDGWSKAIPVRMGGVLDRLRTIAEGLNGRWGWPEAYAVAFVLSDVQIPPVRGRATVTHKWPYPARSTVTIEVVADSVSKSEVADLYAEAVADSNLDASAGAGRPMEDKSVQLAVTAAEHALSDRTWKQTMDVWNTQLRQWQYTDHKQFGNAARRAFKRVTGQALSNPRTTEQRK